jgi:hypothetical protein
MATGNLQRNFTPLVAESIRRWLQQQPQIAKQVYPKPDDPETGGPETGSSLPPSQGPKTGILQKGSVERRHHSGM